MDCNSRTKSCLMINFGRILLFIQIIELRLIGFVCVRVFMSVCMYVVFKIIGANHNALYSYN